MAHKVLSIPIALLFVTMIGCDGSAPLPSSGNDEINRAVVERAAEYINARDYDRLRDVIAEDYLRHSQATPDIDVTSFDQFVEFLQQGAILFPDDRAIFDTLVVEGDLVAFWGRYEGTNTGPGPFPTTGIAVSIEMAGLHRIEDGKIAETWVIWDNMAMFAQLGMPMVPASPPEATQDKSPD